MSDRVELLREYAQAHDEQGHFKMADCCRGAADELDRLRQQVAELTEHLCFVERWANHHAQKPHATPQEVLSVIRHYPPIKAITESYGDGKVPETPDPWAERDALRELLRPFAGLLQQHNDEGDDSRIVYKINHATITAEFIGGRLYRPSGGMTC